MSRASWQPLGLLAALGLMKEQRTHGKDDPFWRFRPRPRKGHTSKVYSKFNRERECTRRRRQIERGVIAVTKEDPC